jgi:23S rRNA (pseudouridine1915-N3)-methyltransferase
VTPWRDYHRSVHYVVLAVGRLRAPYVDDCEHYLKLLGRYARVDVVEVRDDAAIERRIPERSVVCLLDRTGRSLDSEQFSAFLEERRQGGRDVCFVIGGPEGLRLPSAEHRLSLGALTLPHQLARVVLLEQLYRGHKILAGEPYHL